MQFNYSIKATKTQINTIGFLFEPTTIQITIGENDERGENVNITTELRQIIDGGYIVQVRNQLLPVSILNAINGFDIVKRTPAISTEALSQILSTFNLALI